MATVEELLVRIRTIFDATGAKQAQQSVQQVTKQQQLSNDILKSMMADQAATMRSYNAAVRTITKSGGAAPTLTPGAFGIAPPGAAAAAAAAARRQTQDMRQLALATVGYGSAAVLAHQALSALVSAVGDSVQAFREYERRAPDAAIATNTLDDAFRKAEISAGNLQLVIGKIAAPATVKGIDFLTAAINRFREMMEEGGTAREREAKFLENLGKPGAALVPAWEAAAAEVTAQQAAGAGPLDMFARSRQARIYRLNQDLTLQPLSGAQLEAQSKTVNYWQQIVDAATALNDAQNRQIGLQQQSVNLAAAEAEIRLSMLPTQQRLAELQRDVTEQQIRAQIAALPAREGLEDIESRIERDRLLLGMRGALSPEQRYAARAEIRDLTRNALPGARLAAFDVNRQVTLVGRALERVDLEQQLFNITQERTLAQINLAQETNSLLSTIAEQRTQAIQLTINLSGEGFTQEVANQVINVFHSARMVAENTASQQLAGA